MKAILIFLISLNVFALPNPSVTLEYDVVKGKFVDILFIIDNSGSMRNNQIKFKNMAQDFINGLDGVDYKISAISTDIDETLDNFVIARNNPNSARELQDLIMSFGTEGNPSEYVFKRIYDFMGENNFLRSFSDLEIIVITDEEEQSEYHNIGASNLLERFSNKKVRVHTFTELSSNDLCPDSRYEDTERFKEIASLTNGLVFDLCSEDNSLLKDYKFLVKNIVDNLTKRGSDVRPSVYKIEVQKKIDIESVKVFYGSQVISRGLVRNGWVYDSIKNEIILGSDIVLKLEAESDKLTIKYDLK